MKSRSRVNRRKDHRIFARTARRTLRDNIPGLRVERGGTRK